MTFTRQVTLGSEAVRLAILQDVVRAAERGGRTPPELHLLASRATCHYFDQHGNVVPLSKVVVMIDE